VIAAAAGHAVALSVWRFPRPLSPHLAARGAGVTLDVQELAAWVAQEEQRARAPVTLIELAGGAFSPLGPAVSNIDLARALEPAVWLLVAPDSLGVLHDLSATLRAMPRMPDAVVLSCARPPDQSSGTNADELSRLGIAEVLEVVGPGAESCPATLGWFSAHRTYKSSLENAR